MTILLITSEKTFSKAIEKAHGINAAFKFACRLYRNGKCIGFKFKIA